MNNGLTNWSLSFCGYSYGSKGDGGGGVLHFYKQFVKQVNKVSCVTIKQRHLLGKKMIFIIHNFFWIVQKFEGMVPSLKNTILPSFKIFNV